MADTVIASFLNKLAHMLLLEEDLLHEVEDQLWSLHCMLTRITPFLMEVERKQSQELVELKKEAMEKFVKEVITLVLKVEDDVDSYLNTRRRFGLSTEEDRKFRSQIKGMMESQNWFPRFTESCTSSNSSLSDRSPLFITDGYDDDDAVVIPEDEVKRMRDLLLKDEDIGCEVIPVVGHGGIGKTTFVRKVYNDPTIVEHFPCRSWIYVSSNYKVEELLLDIVNQIIKPTTTAATAADADNNEEEIRIEMKKLKDLAFQTYKHLKISTRYLIVFDDVCETDFWADINMVFPAYNKHGSRIIFTTRQDEVALHARPSRPPFYLRRLSKEESWALFSRRVMDMDMDPNHHHTYLQELVNACFGLPLAIIALAVEYNCRGHLLSATDKRLPSGICDYIYNGLPCHLKMCLHYCYALKMEKGYPIIDYKGLLIAEGLIQLPDHQTSSSSATVVVQLEDIAEEYLNELINMNLLKVQRRTFDGRIKKIALPQEFYSLSELYRSEGGVASSKKMKLEEEVRSLFINYSSETATITTLSEDLERILQDSVLLRVLDLTNLNFYPRTINLIHLRYLRLDFFGLSDYTRDFTISLSNLWSLHFLKITFNYYYYDDLNYIPDEQNQLGYQRNHRLPLQFWKMQQLRHLLLRRPGVDPSFATEIQEISSTDMISLKNLQTLESLDAEFCREDVLSMLPNLVTLSLSGQIFRLSDQLARVFPLLEGLKKLRLDGHRRMNGKGMLELEIFPPNITHLTLKRTHFGVQYLVRALRKLHNLRVLKLRNRCIRKVDRVLDFGGDVDNGFRQLKFLKFQFLEFKEWNMLVGVMPSLEKVAVVRCKELEGLPSAALEAITTLKELEVRGCKDGVERDARRIEERVGKDRLRGRLVLIILLNEIPLRMMIQLNDNPERPF